jgi:hypothetical protein
LQQAAQHDQNRGKDADLRIGGGKPDHRRAKRHQEQRQDRRGLAAPPVGIAAQHHAPQRTQEEAHAISGQGQQQLHRRAFRRKEQRADGRRKKL